MPQISRLRVVNCKYNNGARMIPDDLFDLRDPVTRKGLNSVFHLDNGGGKTVLIHLLMQPIVPKARVQSRKIEDYFKSPSDHAFVLIEWDQDGSNEKLLTGIAIKGCTATQEAESKSAIKYYTFMTEYNNVSPYSIEALDLSKNEDGRFVPANYDYMKDVAKVSKGAVSYYSSDEKQLWEKALEDHGINKTEWVSVMENINQEEDGVSKYFDKAKTSRQLLTQFFLPAIDKKVNFEKKDSDSTLKTMFEHYAKKVEEKESIIAANKVNKMLVVEMESLQAISRELCAIHEQLSTHTDTAVGFRAAIAAKTKEVEAELEKLNEKLKENEEKLKHVDHEEASRKYYETKEAYEAAREEFAEAERLLEECKANLQKAKHEEATLECAKLYDELVKAERKEKAILLQIETMEQSSDNNERISELKYSIKTKAEAEEAELNQALITARLDADELKQNRIAAEEAVAEAEKQKAECETAYSKAEAAYENAKQATDRTVKALNVDIRRKLDGFYSDDEIVTEKKAQEAEVKRLEGIIAGLKEEVVGLEQTQTKNPEKAIKLVREEGKLQQELDAKLAEIKLYEEKLASIKAICTKNNTDLSTAFSGTLLAIAKESVHVTENKLTQMKDRRKAVEAKMAAVQNGHLHVPAEIIASATTTGVHFHTGEEFLQQLLQENSITADKLNNLLRNYPEVAYSLVLETEEAIERLLNLKSIEWTASATPLFTTEQVNEMIAGNFDLYTCFAVYDRQYFNDREAYDSNLEQQKVNAEELISVLTEKLEECKNDVATVEGFQYEENWSCNCHSEIEALEAKLSKIKSELTALDEKRKSTEENRLERQQSIEDAKEELSRVNKTIDVLAELSFLIEFEQNAYEKTQEIFIKKRNAETALEEKKKALRLIRLDVEDATDRQNDLENQMQEVLSALSVVRNCVEANVLEGNWRDLLQQYKALTEQKNKDVATLREDLEEIRDRRFSYERELEMRKVPVEDYMHVIYSAERIIAARKFREEMEATYESSLDNYASGSNELGATRGKFEAAEEALKKHGSEPLQKNEVGEDFAERRKALKKSTSELDSTRNILEDQRHTYKGFKEKADGELDDLPCPETVAPVELSEEIGEQWKEIRKAIKAEADVFKKKEAELNRSISTIASKYQSLVFVDFITRLTSLSDLLYDMNRKGDRLYTVHIVIQEMIQNLKRIISKIETDILEIENEKKDLTTQCLIQAKKVYESLLIIENSSKVEIYEGRPAVKMLKLSLPAADAISEEAARSAIETEIERGAEELIELKKTNTPEDRIQKKIESTIGNEKLLLKYVDKDEVAIEVYKIDHSVENSRYIKWENKKTETSGAEGVIMNFVIILSLMNYTRAIAGITDKDSSSVLVLDNPFGKLTSKHLLDPLFAILEKFNTQLICTTHINNAEVNSCFGTVVKLVIKQQPLSGKSIMTHEGNERIEHGYYKMVNRQMTLF